MSKSLKATILIVSVFIISFVVAGEFGVHASSSDGAYRQLNVYSEVLSRIRSEYVEDPNLPVVTTGALHGLLESLDANSSYLTPDEYRRFKQEQKKPEKGTIGATISKRAGYAVVVAVVPGGPADKAGIENGDILEAIENQTSREMSLAEIRQVLQGEPGSNTNVYVVRPPRLAAQKVTITRELVNSPAAVEKGLENAIAYLNPQTLSKGKAEELAKAIKDLQKNGANKLVLDLRNVAAGEIEEGVAVANLFMNHGVIGYVQGQKYNRQTFNADPQKAVAASIPLVVLVNRSTFGPAELVAAAILENARGDVLGDKTFGSGSLQKTIEMEDGSALILSVAKYYSPSGRAIQDLAVTPNVLVAGAEEDIIGTDEEESPDNPSQQPLKRSRPPQTDEQLMRAVEMLKKRA